MSNSWRTHGLQHGRLLCPPLSLGVCWNSCTLSWWWDPTISSPVVPSSCLNLSQYPGLFQIPEKGLLYFHMHWLFASGGQVLELQLQHRYLTWIFRVFPYYPLVWPPCCPRDSQESSPAPQLKKHQFCGAQPCFWSSSHISAWLLEKP